MFFKTIFNNKGSRIWFIITVAVAILIIIVNILMTTVFSDLFNIMWGGPRRILGEGGLAIYTADFDTKQDARLNAEAVNEKLTGEGTVLLKNSDINGLPLAKNASVSVFGKNSVSLVCGISGSSASSGEYEKSIYNSLEKAGILYNPKLKEFYENTASGAGRPANFNIENDGNIILWTGETPQENYTQQIKDSYSDFNDAAIIVISRIGGEGGDLPRKMADTNGNPVAGAASVSDHYLQLDQNEQDLISEVTSSGIFEKVILLINSATTIELGAVKDNDKIDSCLWIGAPGDTGIMSLGGILNGEINPSGRTVDTWVRNFKEDPTWQNFGDNLTVGGQNYTGVSDKISSYDYSFVDYEEGIYVGYRYYETRGKDNESWYNENVVYSFGYGKSYTTFSQRISNKSSLNNMTITASSKIKIDVEVKNTGSTYSGKDVVQLYVTTPYNGGGIEKSHVVLAGFAKSNLLAPNESEIVSVQIDPYDFASYDHKKTLTEYGGFVLETGDYEIKLMNNSHDSIDSFNAEVSKAIKFDKVLTAKDSVSGENNISLSPAVNRFDDADDQLINGVLSRSGWTNFPEMRSAEEKKLDSSTNAKINSVETNNPISVVDPPLIGQNGTIMLEELVDRGYEDSLWDKLLDRIKGDDLIKLFNKGGNKTAGILDIGKPETVDADGPAGFANFMANSDTVAIYGTSHYACEPIIAATWNTELLYDFGVAVGNEALVGNERGDKAPYTGWYAPGVNIHRSPFGGRAGEYFSEDGYLSGMLAANEIKGAMSKGVYTQVKHFAVNEQETSRAGICTWLDEQTLREIYLKPFEKAVKVGGTRGMMSSFNRIGTVWAGGDYRLLTEVLRDEWGFRGMVISDFNTGGHMNSKQMAYAGGDLNLQTLGQDWNAKKSDATDMTVLRTCAKNILYAVANSNAMNVEVIGYNLPIWTIQMLIIDAVIVVALVVWGFFMIRRAFRKRQNQE